MSLVVGVLALQGAFHEHINLLKNAATTLQADPTTTITDLPKFSFVEVRTAAELNQCDALIIPGGESTTMSLVASSTGLLEPLRDFVKLQRKPTWGTCAGLIMLAESANRTKQGGQELIGGLDVRVNRNHFGRQVESFHAPLDLPFLSAQATPPTDQQPFPGVFIRAPVVEKLLPVTDGPQTLEALRPDTVIAPSKETKDLQAKDAVAAGVEVLARLPGRAERLEDKVDATDKDTGDIVAVRQGNVFGTSFHPELTTDMRIHLWWLQRVIEARLRR